MTIKAVITTLDNLPNLKESIAVLRSEPVDEIIIVNNGSIDGTKDWLAGQGGLTVINRENKGAGPGRNAGLDAAGECDYFLMLDGGIRPLRGGTRKMLEYLEQTPHVDVIGVEIADFETDKTKAWRRWTKPINAYQNTRLSHTAYCLARYKAFDSLRFNEYGPFSQVGWGVDDDEMAYQWNDAGIVIHVATGVHPYRHASGSWGRIKKETGIGANQYGSAYEQRLVWLQQNYPQYEPGEQWGEPWLTVVVKADDIESTAKMIKSAHNQLRRRRFVAPWQQWSNPYSVVAWGDGSEWLNWAEPRRLRQHHGTTAIVDGEIIRRNEQNESIWTGDFRLCTNGDWRGAIRPDAYYYGLVTNQAELDTLIQRYNEIHPPQLVKNPPAGKGDLCS